MTAGRSLGTSLFLLYHGQHLASFLRVASWYNMAAGAQPSFPYPQAAEKRERKRARPFSLEEASRRSHVTLRFTWPAPSVAGKGGLLAGDRAA